MPRHGKDTPAEKADRQRRHQALVAEQQRAKQERTATTKAHPMTSVEWERAIQEATA